MSNQWSVQHNVGAEDWREQGIRCTIHVSTEVFQNDGWNKAEKKTDKSCIKIIDEWRGGLEAKWWKQYLG